MLGVLSAAAQTSAPNEWTWIGGNSTFTNLHVGWPGIYGTLGVPSSTNIPGARDSAATWTDQDGDLWLFGGFGYDSAGSPGDLNDLWKFNISTHLWIWIGGSNTLPIPQFSTGQPGVYGTLGVPAPENIPDGRKHSVTWTDKAGKLWLFGGEGYGTIDSLTGNLFFNDLWKFDPTTNEWAWMAGDSQTGITNSGQPGVYGTLGTPASQNIPGSRYSAIGWIDESGNFWLFGGEGYDSARYDGDLNDLWQFNPSTNQWTWMSGSSTIAPGSGGRPGVYGTLGVPAAANVPGGRDSAISWSDGSGNFWLFGGEGYDSGVSDPNNAGYLNDLWEFNPSTTEWTWMDGSNTLPCNDVCGAYGVYGTLGTPAAQNVPGGREGAANWADSKGNFWLFGGLGFASAGTYSYLNDIWEFDPSTNKWTWMGGDTTIPPCQGQFQCGSPGVYGTLGVSAAANIPGSRNSAQSWSDHSGNLWLFGGYGDDSLGYNADLNDLWSYQPSAAPVPPAAATPIFSPAAGTYTSTQSVTITASTPGARIHYTTDGVTIPTVSSPLYTAAITVSADETIQAIAIATNYLNSPVASGVYTINLPPPDFSVSASPTSLLMSAGQSGVTTVSVTAINGFSSAVSFTCSGLPAGASCSFSPSTVTPSGAAASTTLTVTASTASTAIRHAYNPFIPGSALAVTFCCFGWKTRRRLRFLVLLAASMSGLGTFVGCGGGGSPSTPQPVTSTITVAATSGTLQHTTTFTLTLN